MCRVKSVHILILNKKTRFIFRGHKKSNFATILPTKKYLRPSICPKSWKQKNPITYLLKFNSCLFGAYDFRIYNIHSTDYQRLTEVDPAPQRISKYNMKLTFRAVFQPFRHYSSLFPSFFVV